MKLYENDDIYVRPFTEDDMKEPYLNWFHDPKVTKFNSHGLFPYTSVQKKAFIASLDTNVVWAIMAKETIVATVDREIVKKEPFNTHIGNISLQSINWINRSAEFAVVIGNTNYWGKGICTQVGYWLFNHGFKKLNLNRIWSGTAAVNTGMIKVFKKLGMKEEGRFRDGTYLAGDYYDVVCYGKLRREWKK